jgi:glyoxylase-like metal-dependent hydrolase (beta-lactamase superfamily II)
MAASLDVRWIHGSPLCSYNTDPPVQVHRYDADTFILRQNKCVEPTTSFEGPFMYMLFGDDRVMLLDTGATRSPQRFPIGNVVRGIISDWLTERGQRTIPLLVCHSHSHDDHAQGDGQFSGRPGVTIAPRTLTALRQFFGLASWPEGRSTLELGGRTLDVIAIPGHEASHLAFYDRREKILLTGDTLYPGLLVVHDWDAYRASVSRLARFAESNEITFILGAHIEMKSEPGKWFGLPTTFQPGEHVLQLETRHLRELNEALSRLPTPRHERHDDFIIHPAELPLPPPDV